MYIKLIPLYNTTVSYYRIFSIIRDLSRKTGTRRFPWKPEVSGRKPVRWQPWWGSTPIGPTPKRYIVKGAAQVALFDVYIIQAEHRRLFLLLLLISSIVCKCRIDDKFDARFPFTSKARCRSIRRGTTFNFNDRADPAPRARDTVDDETNKRKTITEGRWQIYTAPFV